MDHQTEKLLRHRHPALLPSSLSIDTDNGWFFILDALCGLLDSQEGAGETTVRVSQIKEKFGELRFYTDGHSGRQDGSVEFAEALSGRICEACGMPGSLRGRNWVVTLCDRHAAKSGKPDDVTLLHEPDDVTLPPNPAGTEGYHPSLVQAAIELEFFCRNGNAPVFSLGDDGRQRVSVDGDVPENVLGAIDLFLALQPPETEN